MPAQYRLGPDQQPEPAEHVAWEPVQQGGQEHPVARAEPRPGLAKLPLQDRDLVAQGQDLHVLVLYVPRTSSTSCDQAIFVDQAADTG